MQRLQVWMSCELPFGSRSPGYPRQHPQLCVGQMKTLRAFSGEKCICYALMVMTSPFKITLATLTFWIASSVLQSLGKSRWAKAIDIAFCLCCSSALYHSQFVFSCLQNMCWCMWQLFLWIPKKMCICFIRFVFMRSRCFALLLVQTLSRLLRNRRPPSHMMRIRAYHGTHQRNVDSIRRFGFRPSVGGMLGPGVYISRDLNKVQRYCKWYRGLGVILELKVEVGAVCTIDKQGHSSQKRQKSFDTAWVPSNCSMVQSQLEEGCVAEARNIQVVRVWHSSELLRLFVHEVIQLVKDTRATRAAAATSLYLKSFLFTQRCTVVETSAGRLHRVKLKKGWPSSSCAGLMGPRQPKC